MKYTTTTRLKFIVTFIVVLFIGQELLIHNYISEPYPALRMPPFYGNSMNEAGYYERTSVDIEIKFGPNDKLELTPREFFYNAPLSHVWALIQNFTPPSDSLKSKYHIGEFTSLEQILPGYIVSRSRTPRSIQQNAETHEWLRQQILKIHPSQKPESISFLWYRDQYHPTDLLNRKRDLTGTTTIKL